MFKLITISAVFAAAALAQTSSVGNWTYVDGPKTTFIRTFEESGQLKAVIEKVTKGGQEDASATCAKCAGENKDKPLKGLTILWDTKKDGANWKDGKLLDPDGGRLVSGATELIEGGKKMNVKGSVSIIHKTQLWIRVP